MEKVRRSRRAAAKPPEEPRTTKEIIEAAEEDVVARAQEEKRGPWCPHCQYEYAEHPDTPRPAKEHAEYQAFHASVVLAAEAKLPIICPGCGTEGVPVYSFPERLPGPKYNVPDIDPGIERIIQSVFTLDFNETWVRLHKRLTVGEQRIDHATIVKHLDEAQDNAREAHKLAMAISVEYERFKVDQEVIMSGMRDEANDALQAEKDSGNRSKTITDADTASKMAQLHPDEYAANAMKKQQFEKSMKHAENFAERWARKAQDLGNILLKMRGGGVS